jgi:hypothetical protein
MHVCSETRQEIITNRVRGAILVAGDAGAEFRRAENLDIAVLSVLQHPSHILKLKTSYNRGQLTKGRHPASTQHQNNTVVGTDLCWLSAGDTPDRIYRESFALEESSNLYRASKRAVRLECSGKICFWSKLFIVSTHGRFPGGNCRIASTARKNKDLAYSVSQALPIFY